MNNIYSRANATMDQMDNLKDTSVKRTHGDGANIHVINDSSMTATAAALRKPKQQEEEKYKLLNKNLTLELEIKVKGKSHGCEGKPKQPEDNNGLND